jgi:hypothetical protein
MNIRRDFIRAVLFYRIIGGETMTEFIFLKRF